MLTLAWPWLLLAGLAPLHAWLRPAPRAEGGLRVPGLLAVLPAQALSSRRQSLPALLAWLGFLALVVAAARPQHVGEPLTLPESGRDLMLVVDLSGSMEFEDMLVRGQPVNRLVALQQIAGEFLERRAGDRVGLIVFGDRPYLQTPLTFDLVAVRDSLMDAEIGLAGQRTAIGDALGLAVKRLVDQPAQSRVAILLTDGANSAGRLAPLQAADLAAKARLKVYTIGIGAEQMVVDSWIGRRVVNPSSDLDEPTMRDIAERTGGRYYRARSTKELAQIYAEIEQLEPRASDEIAIRPRLELYPWPAGLGLALILGAVLLLRWRSAPMPSMNA